MIENRISDRAKILLIDEDTSISYLIRRAMEKENYKIYIAGSGKQGMEMSTGVCPDLILMDNKFSDMEGITLIQWFREWTDCPIIILSERSSYLDKVEALYAGADDYMVKPFHEKELAARIFSALRRRISAGAHTYYEAGNLKVDFTKRQVLLGGTEVHFSPVEYRIIESLASLLTSSEKNRTLPVALQFFNQSLSYDYTKMFAALTLVVVPAIIVYCFAQEQVQESVAASGIKG